MKLALLSITGAAALSGVTTTTDWTAARSALRQRDVGAVVVEGAAAPADAWRGAMEGDACAAVDVSCEACDCAVAAVQSAFAPLWGAADEDGAAAAQIVDLARCYDRCLADKSDGGRVRVRATVTRGRATAPCPKLHTDFVALRGLPRARQTFNPTSASTQSLQLRSENSRRAIDSSKNLPNRHRSGRAGEFRSSAPAHRSIRAQAASSRSRARAPSSRPRSTSR